MAPKIPPRSPSRASSRQTTPTKTHESTFRNQAQKQQDLVDDSSLKQHILTGSSKNTQGKTVLPLNQPSRKNRITDNNKTHQQVSAYHMSLSLPDEIILKIVDLADFNPMALMALLECKSSEGGQSDLNRVAYDNQLWVSFAPHKENCREMPNGYHAEQFLKRYDVMSPEVQELLKALWTGAKEEKSKALAEVRQHRSVWNNYDIMRAAVRVDGLALNYADENLKGDKGIVLAAVGQNGFALTAASEHLKDDRDIVFDAVRQQGFALKAASERLKDDRDIVFDAVRQQGLALQFASERLKDDRDIVLAAVTQKFYALQFASDNLKDNRDMVFDAVRQQGLALHCASERLKGDPELRSLAGWPPLPEH